MAKIGGNMENGRNIPCPKAEALQVAPLDCFSRDDLLQAGGKAVNLGELLQADFPVPPGFVVTTAAYDRFISHNDLSQTINRMLPGDMDGGPIRTAFENALIPPDVEQTIRTAYQELGNSPVAVRSSATAEDLPQAAFAGQQDTFLNIIDVESMLKAVRRCWTSLWNDRAIAYRQRLGIDPQTVKLAVVIQRMVQAEAAGVMFTANPVTGTRDEIVVDASPGLGEAVVSGLVTPEQVVLDKHSGHVKVRQPGRQEVIIQARQGGGTEQIERTADHSPLPDIALLRLAHVGVAIERLFGSPQDIEWAWKDGQLFILQARPMTALPEPPPHPSKPVQLVSALFAEMFPIRPYPLDQTTWVNALSAGAVEPIFSLLGLAVPPISQLFIEENGVVIQFRGRVAFRPTLGILLAPARILYLALRYDPIQYQADLRLAEYRRRARLLEMRPLPDLSWETLLSLVRETLSLALPLAGEPRRHYFPRALLAAGLLRIALGLLGRGGLFATIFSGVKSSTSEANHALELLALQIRNEPVLARTFLNHEPEDLLMALESLESEPSVQSFLEDLQTFLDRYGHREVVLSTALEPTWKDAPEVVLGMVKGFALTEPRDVEARPAWVAARDELLSHPLLRLSPLRSANLKLLTTARCFWQIREDTHFDVTRVLPILRRTLLELGRRLTGAGVLDAPEEVFHLRMEDLERVGGTWPPAPSLAAGLRSSVTQRRDLRLSLAGTPVVDPRLYRPLEPGDDALLLGTSGSPGVAQGPARVICDASEFGKLRLGEVLVAPYTNPSWTPLFQRAAAVVVDGGGAGSHAAIVAREYGIPAVMGTVSGTQKLRDGQWIEVDGYGGIVRPVQPPM